MKTFFKTVMAITIFSICEKFLGFLYRIYLSRSIGSEGIGLYQVALSVFALLLTLACSGIPITVSRLMTKYKAEENPKKVSQIISSGLFLAVFFSLPICVILFVFKDKLTLFFSDSRCIPIFLIVLPSLVFNSVYAVMRGVFWGNKDFLPYAVLELLEEICMIFVGILLIGKAQTVYQGAIYAGVAVLCSYIFSFLSATIFFAYRKTKLASPYRELKPLLFSSVPVTLMRTANSLAVSLVSILLPLRLVLAGYSNSQAMSLFGSAAGQAMPILYIPTTLIGSFTLVLVPEISENFYKKRKEFLKNDIEKAIKFTTFLSCIFIPVFTVCGKEIGILIFDNYNCGTYLSYSSFLMLFMGLSGITTSVLNSIGLEKQTLLFYIIGAIFLLLSVYFLPKFLGIYSLLVGFTFVYATTTLFNLILLRKYCPIKLSYKKFVAFSTVFCLPTMLWGVMLKNLLLPFLGTFFTFIACAVLLVIFYCLLFFVFGIIKIDVIKNLKTKKATNKSVAKNLA